MEVIFYYFYRTGILIFLLAPVIIHQDTSDQIYDDLECHYQKYNSNLILIEKVPNGKGISTDAVIDFLQGTWKGLLQPSLPNLFLPQDSDSCFQKIMEYEDFLEVNARWDLQLGNENEPSLFIFGAVHSKDPSHSQFDSIEYFWNLTKPDIAFFEGPDRGVRPSRASTIEELGESGFIRYLASQENVESKSLEPNPLAEYEHLRQYFTSDKIKLFYLLREAQRVRIAYSYGEEEITTHINELLQKVAKIASLNDTINSLTELKSAFNQYWGNTSVVWWKAPANWFDPLLRSDETGGIFTNDINRLSSEFRNQHMYRVITNELQQRKTVMVVVGRNHVPMISEALKCWWSARGKAFNR